MSKTLQIFMLLAVALYFVLLVFFLRRKRINLKYTLLWIFSGVVMLLLALPGILDRVAAVVGIASPVNALFAVALFCIIIILMSLTAIVSRLNNQLLQLAQANALLERRVRELEAEGTK